MFNLKQADSKYNDDMQPLSDILKVSVELHRSQFKELVARHNEKMLSTITGQLEFEEFLTKIIPEIQRMLSPAYIKKILHKYFTEYGQIAIIHDALKTTFMVEYDELSKSF